MIKEFLQKFGIDIKRYYPERFAVKYAKEKFGSKEIVACEIGVFEGKHALEILKNLNIKKLYLIDPYIRYLDYKNDGCYNRVEEAKIKAHELLKDYEDTQEGTSKIVWIEKFSDEAYNDIKEKCDFIYIDGNHEFSYVFYDIRNYYELLKETGMIAGHDFHIEWSGVVKAVNQFARENKLNIVTGCGDDWILLK